MSVPVQHIIESVHDASRQTEKLVLLIGRPGSGKSKVLRELATMRGWKYVDTRSLITDEILEMAPKARPQQVPYLMSDFLADLDGEVILLDGIEVLFAPVLNLDPLALIRQISRKHTLVVGWPGEVVSGNLMIDYNGNRKLCSGETENLMIISL